jgi:cobalt-zinc-cadmium efflux system outer membrane protein
MGTQNRFIIIPAMLLVAGCASQRNVVSDNSGVPAGLHVPQIAATRSHENSATPIQLVSAQTDEKQTDLQDSEEAQHTDAKAEAIGSNDPPSEPSLAHPVLMNGESGLSGPHEVEFYIQFALSRNPEILAAQHAVSVQSQRYPQVTALDDPMLVETFQPFDNHSVQTAAGRGPNVLSLSQKFPWFGKLRVRGEVVHWETHMAFTRLAQARLKVSEDVKLAYYDVAFNQRAIVITEANRDLLEELLQFAEARYRTGKTSQQDILVAQVRIVRLQDQLVALHRQLALAQADLAKSVQTAADANLLAATDPIIPSVPIELQSLYEAAGRFRPEIQERLYSVMRDRRTKRLAELQYRPDVTAGLGWQAITGNDALSRVANGNDNLAFTIGINVPIWRDKLRAGVCEAEQRILESSRRHDVTRDDTMRMVRRLMVQARAAEQQLELFNDSIIPKSEQALLVSTADYRVDKVDFQTIMDNWSELLMFQLQVARLESNLAQALASLERVIGCELATLPFETESIPPAPLEFQAEETNVMEQ